MVKRINIVIVEPSAIIRCGIATLLQRASITNINIAEVADLSALLSGAYSHHEPDLLIINPSYLGMFPLSQLKAEVGNESLKILALQNALADQSMLGGYDETISIFDTLETIKDKVTSATTVDEEQEVRKELSAREKEIIVFVVKGMTNKQIADILCLSAHTVIAHRRNIANKLQIHSPSGLTIYAIVNKLVDLSEIKNAITKDAAE